tara:strand:- start:164 stop:559 length:396 start_codon:yes stop_codon:yes gene_type:complete
MGIQYYDNLCYIFLMSDKRTYKSHKEHGLDITYENEIQHKMDDRGNLDLTKQIDTLKAEKVALYEKVKNLQTLEEDHQKLNGKLRLEVANIKEELEKYKKDQDIKNDNHTIELLQKDNEIGRLMKKLQDKR